MRKLHVAWGMLACLGFFGAACGPEFAVVPQNGAPSATAQAGGAVVTALCNQWDGVPFDLADYLTPIAVELYNAGPSEVRVSFVDFALRDEHGTRFASVSPFIPDALGELDGPLVAPNLVASRGGGGFGHASGGMHSSGGARSGGVTVSAPLARRGFGRWGASGGGFHGGGGFRVYGGLRSFYGPGAAYWLDPLLYPPWGPWVLWWTASTYPGPPSHDVLLAALPEGVLPPGAYVSGFLYFQKATSPSTRNLRLDWSVHDARTGQPLGAPGVTLDVLER